MHLSRALLVASFCLSSLLLAGARGAFAQPRGAGAKDTTAVLGFLRPTYTSTYSVVRQSAVWDQVFSFKNKWNGITINNSTDYKIQTDSSRPNFQNRGGDTNTTLGFTVLRGLPMELSLNYNRYGIDNTNTTEHGSTLDSDIKGTYNARFFRGAAGSIAAGFGFVKRNTQNNFSGGESSARELGLSQDLKATANYNGPLPGMIFKFNGTYTALHKSTKSSQLVSSAEGPTGDSKNTMGFDWNWSPWTSWSASASLTRQETNQQYILSIADINKNNKREVARDKQSGFTTSIGYKPAGGATDLSATFTLSNSGTQRKVRLEQVRNSDGYDLDFKARHLLLGNTMSAHFLSRNENQGSIVMGPGNTVTRWLEGYIERPWTPNLTTRVFAEIWMRSQKYEDTESRQQDFDRLKKRVETTTNYKFWSKFTANLNARWVGEDAVYIDVSQSRGTQFEETYAAGGTLTYAMTSRTAVTQKYDFNELFTQKRFDAGNSSMQRNRSVSTSVATGLSKKITVSFSHSYSFQELGGYRRDDQGARFFSRGNLKYRQELKTSVNYSLADWITFGTEERLNRNDDITTIPYGRTSTSQITFTQRGNFTRPIPGGGTFTCNMAMDIQKYTRPHGNPKRYFTATLSLDKSF